MRPGMCSIAAWAPIVRGADRRDLADTIRIDGLTAVRGNQNYALPENVELSGEWTVLVWCETFALEVANATLSL